MPSRRALDVSSPSAARCTLLALVTLLAACDGPRDGEEDAAVRSDAGPLDAGAADAASPDAASPDGGTPDDDAGAGLGYTALGLGYRHSCAVTSEGVARCWGSNFTGQLGRTPTGASLGSPGDVEDLEGVVAISGGENHSCALLDDGSLTCWGDDADGQLGRGGAGFGAHPPAIVAGLSGVTAVACGGDHTCALADGRVYCWGANDFGQLGDGTTTDRAAPVEVAGVTGAVALGAGDFHSCAATAGGVRCWGLNTDGQLGDGTTTNRSEPVDVMGATGVVELDGGGGFTCARSDAGVLCWGAGDAGQLGDGSSGDRSSAALVTGSAGALGIAAGSRHACARFADGAARCWGYNARGQIGDGADLSGLPGMRRTPVMVVGLADVSAIAAGGSQTCAIARGSVYCWGDDSAGQLGNGDGSSGDQSTPAEVLP